MTCFNFPNLECLCITTTPKSCYPQKYPNAFTYPLYSDRDARVCSTWLDKLQASESYRSFILIHRKWRPSTTTYYSFKENKRKTKAQLGKISYLEIFRTVKSDASFWSNRHSAFQARQTRCRYEVGEVRRRRHDPMGDRGACVPLRFRPRPMLVDTPANCAQTHSTE